MNLTFFAALFGLQLVVASLLFLVSLYFKRNDVADVAWGPGIALSATVGTLLSGTTLSWPHYLFLALVWVWALRLGLRIFQKNAKKPEDSRYKAWRDSWGSWFYLRSFFQVFVLQALLMPLIAISVIIASLFEANMFSTPLLALGALVWLVGFFFEVVGDWQLDEHIKNPEKTGLMQSGLWRYTRHPNYFGEITMWWGLWIATLSLPLWWMALISPLTITILILFVSGVPMLERLMAKYDGWEAYKQRTSMLIPLPPRRSSRTEVI